MKEGGNKFNRFWNFLKKRMGTDSIRTNLLQAIPFWFASLITGIIAVAYTNLFVFAEELFIQMFEWASWSIFIVAPVCFVLAYLLVYFFAPNAKGSGIPQVMAAIELADNKQDNKISKLLGVRILLVKIISSLLMAFGGGSIGREGPTIQIAGSVFSRISKWVPKSWPRLSNQSYILTGAAAGLAAAFNTPLGGVVFAMEELARIHIRFISTALFSAVIIAGLTAQALLGPYLYLGYPDVRGLGFSIFFAVAATAILAGMLGAFMCRMILKVMKWKRNFGLSKSIFFAIGAGIVVASTAYFINDAIIGSGKEFMNEALFTEQKSTGWQTIVLRIFGPILAFNTGAAGGVFAPSLSAGASVGAFISGVFEFTGSNANILILGGMVGFLTGVTRTPFTSAILVLEMTDRHSVIFHLMLAAMVSNVAALLVDKHSFYGQLKRNYLHDVGKKESEITHYKG